MSAANTDKVRNAAPNFATTLANSMLISDTSMVLQSATGLPTATAITLVIDATDPSSGASTPTLKEVVTGTLSGTTVSNLLRGQDGTTQQAHSSGANVVMWITANLWTDFQTSYLTQHNQLGTHGAITGTSITTTGNGSIGGTLGVTGVATFTAVPVLPASTITTANIQAAAVTAAKMANGMVKNRQGGTTGDNTWITKGTSNTDTSAKAVFLQAGAIGLSTSGTDVTVTFPTAYTVAPLVLATVITSASANVYCTVNSTTTSTFKIRAVSADGSSETASWLAIGQ